MRSYFLYSLIRLALFAAVWALLFVLLPKSIPWIYSGILAAVVAMLISILLLGKPRQAVASELQGKVQDMQAKRQQTRTLAEQDADAEDALLDQKTS